MAGDPVPAPDHVTMPAPTVWPAVMALGVTLLAGGLVMNPVYCALGGLLLVIGGAGWVGQWLPGRGEVEEPVAAPAERAPPVRADLALPTRVERLRPGMPGARLELPVEMHPYSAGVKGGIVGGVGMAAVAELWGLLTDHGLWYPINLLAGTVLPGLSDLSVDELKKFSAAAFLVGLFLHAVGSVGIGLLNGVLLPMFPRFPILWGGVLAPLLWSGFVWGFMGVINPLLAERVDWPWFIASQFVYGLIAGAVVLRSEKVPTGPPLRRPRGEGQ